MFSNQSTDISLNAPCRALAAICGDKIENRFIVGTCSVNSNNNNNTVLQENNNNNNNNNNSAGVKNRLVVLKFHNEVNELSIESDLDHFTGSVGVICCHPTDPSMVLTATEQAGSTSAATLWKIPQGENDDENYNGATSSSPEYDEYGGESEYGRSNGGGGGGGGMMERLASLEREDESTAVVTDIAWRDGGAEADATSPGDVLTIDMDGNLSQWDISFGAADPVKTISLAQTTNKNNKIGLPPPCRVQWDPHSSAGDTLAASYGNSVHILDWRLDTSIPSGTVDKLQNCHRYGVTDIHYNPNKPYVLATAGQDGLLKFWDLRATKQHPLLTARGGHSHWVWNVQYNPFHDQLVLSTGTDSVVNLWRLSTISSAPLLTYGDDDDFGAGKDHSGAADAPDASGRGSDTSSPNVRVGRYEHGDSVYAAAWGATDAWIYMTIGYDGKAVLNHVPSKEKYKILL